MARVEPLISRGLLRAELHTIDDVNLFLKKLPEGFKRKFLISILRAAANQTVKAAKGTLKSSLKGGDERTGALVKSIATRTFRKKYRDVVTVVAQAGARRSVIKKFPEVRRYAVGVEWGMNVGYPNQHAEHVGGYGYMRKAYEGNKTQARQMILDQSRRIISQTQKRYLKQGRYTLFG